MLWFNDEIKDNIKWPRCSSFILFYYPCWHLLLGTTLHQNSSYFSFISLPQYACGSDCIKMRNYIKSIPRNTCVACLNRLAHGDREIVSMCQPAECMSQTIYNMFFLAIHVTSISKREQCCTLSRLLQCFIVLFVSVRHPGKLTNAARG